jgi:hypothetical protein
MGNRERGEGRGEGRGEERGGERVRDRGTLHIILVILSQLGGL